MTSITKKKKKKKKIKTKYITIVDKNYPKFLKSTFRPPFVIYYKGNKNKNREKKWNG